jgi:hypothetical protein
MQERYQGDSSGRSNRLNQTLAKNIKSENRKSRYGRDSLTRRQVKSNHTLQSRAIWLSNSVPRRRDSASGASARKLYDGEQMKTTPRLEMVFSAVMLLSVSLSDNRYL